MWRLTSGLLGDGRLDVAVVGVGGTGSEIVAGLTHLHAGLNALGYGGIQVVAFDPDIVTEANVVRQRYTQHDIGRFKAETLIERINLACNLEWKAVPTTFDRGAARRSWDLVISCVDTRAARRRLHGYAFADRLSVWKLWLDCGNDVSTGQVILGTPRGKSRKLSAGLPCATELHPELMDVALDDKRAPSCSALEALQRQDLMVNKAVAVLALDLLWRLFRDGAISCHARYFDLAGDALSAAAVPARGAMGRMAGHNDRAQAGRTRSARRPQARRPCE